MDFLEEVKHTSIAIDKYIIKQNYHIQNLFQKFLKIKSGLSKRISSIPVHLK